MDLDGFGRGEEIKPCRLCQVWEKKGNHIEFDRFERVRHVWRPNGQPLGQRTSREDVKLVRGRRRRGGSAGHVRLALRGSAVLPVEERQGAMADFAFRLSEVWEQR